MTEWGDNDRELLSEINRKLDLLLEQGEVMSNAFDVDVAALTAAVTEVQQEVATLNANATDPAGLAALNAATANLTSLLPVAPAAPAAPETPAAQ